MSAEVPGPLLRSSRQAVIAALLFLVGCGNEVPAFQGPAFQRDPPQVGSLRGRIVTSNNGDDTLSVLDPSGPLQPKRLVLGFSPVELEGPHHLSADAQGRFVYVNLSMAVFESGSGPHGVHGSGNLPGYVVKIDAATARTVAWTQVDPNPGDNTLSADGKTLYVTHYDLIRWARGAAARDFRQGDSNLIVIDTESMIVKSKTPICPGAHGARLSADQRTFYSTCGPDEIAIVDLSATPPAVRRVSLTGGQEAATCQLCPYALAVAPDGLVWISNLGQNNGSAGRGSLMFFDPRLNGGSIDQARTVRLRGSAVFAGFLPTADGSYRAMVPEQSATESWVRVYGPPPEGQPPPELQALALPAQDCVRAHMLSIAAGGKQGHLVCEGDHRGPGSFVWLDLENLTVIGSQQIGVFPDGLAFVPAAP